eukprot:PITA_34497
MSKLINLFSNSDKLEGTKSYKTWHRLIESTLIYNELWQGICDGDVKPNKPTDAAALGKWEVKNAKALALIKSSVNDEMYVHIENATDAWSALKNFKDLFDTQPESKKVDLQLKLLQQKLTKGGDVLECISRLKNIRQEIINDGFPAINDSFMVTIVIAGLPSSYTHFLETLQLTGKLEKLKFDELCEMLTQHDKTFGNKTKVGEDVFLTEASTSKSSADSSRGRGKGNQNQATHNVQSRGQSQSRGNNFNRGNSSGRSNFQGRGNNQVRDNFQGQGNNNQGRGQSQHRIQSRGRGQSSGRGRDLSQIVCRRCNKVGHYAEDCQTSLNKIPKFQQHPAQFANDQDEDNSEYVFTSSPVSQLSSHLRSDYEDAWILDSGATQHMNCRHDFFWNFQDCQLNSIFLADDTKHTPYGKGAVKVFLRGNGEKKISNVCENGIRRQLTNVYTPQQNGVVERMNQTFLGMARSMLTFKRLSPTYWVEAIHTAVYLRNQSPTACLDRITPYEAWFGLKPRVKHLRVFGSVCYALVPKEKRTNLDSRSLKCTMIGYSDEKKGYRLLTNGKFIVSRDVIFYETESKSAKEIENLLHKLQTKRSKRNGKMQSQPTSPNWYELDFPSSEDESSSPSTSTTSFGSSSSSSASPSSSSSSDSDSRDSSAERRTSVYINPLYNDGDFTEAQTSEHHLPKWAVQLLKDVKPDEQNKTGTQRAHRSEGNFALIANDFTEPSTYKETVKHKEWQ